MLLPNGGILVQSEFYDNNSSWSPSPTTPFFRPLTARTPCRRGSREWIFMMRFFWAAYIPNSILPKEISLYSSSLDLTPSLYSFSASTRLIRLRGVRFWRPGKVSWFCWGCTRVCSFYESNLSGQRDKKSRIQYAVKFTMRGCWFYQRYFHPANLC